MVRNIFSEEYENKNNKVRYCVDVDYTIDEWIKDDDTIYTEDDFHKEFGDNVSIYDSDDFEYTGQMIDGWAYDFDTFIGAFFYALYMCFNKKNQRIIISKHTKEKLIKNWCLKDKINYNELHMV